MLYTDLLNLHLVVFILIIKYKVDALAESIFSMLLIILIDTLISIIHASIIDTCTGLLIIISNMFIFLVAKALLYLLLVIIPRDLIVLVI